MAKNVVVCCDGTANEFAKNRTNVAKLFFTLIKEPAQQATFYHPGVGTMAPAGFVTKTGAFLAQVAGLAFGFGLSNDIRDLYICIAKVYEPGDKLFLFGFSRGAYTVRALASLLHMYGLIPSGNDPLVPYITRMMWRIRDLRKHSDSPKSKQKLDDYFDLARDFKDTFSRECKPHFLGVWDTVSSVGWFTDPTALPFTANNPDIEIGRHAIAIDERRAFFRTNLWRPSAVPAEGGGPKDLKQVWFPGVHCDVGGGYAEAKSGLSKIPLQWMIAEAKAAGLLVEDAKVADILGGCPGFAPPDPNGEMHNSMSAAWRIVEYVPKPHWNGKTNEWRRNLARQRTWPAKPCVHDAAWERAGGYSDRLPADAIKLSAAFPVTGSDQA